MKCVEWIDGVKRAFRFSPLVVFCSLMFGSPFAAFAATVPEVIDASNAWLARIRHQRADRRAWSTGGGFLVSE
ncbi:hypothetical protein [Sinimarinibacterium thermocellulolyticum]|uniref:Uncharacterized protein n=1 Tax=Sinimarinibacterium thermocellulolyticum TaxID=3170016 RepID=A0ABV2ADS3_9GAMM